MQAFGSTGLTGSYRLSRNAKCLECISRTLRHQCADAPKSIPGTKGLVIFVYMGVMGAESLRRAFENIMELHVDNQYYLCKLGV